MYDYVDAEENVGEDVWVKVVPDAYPQDPREDDQLGHMFCWHPQYQLGNEQFKEGDADGARDMREVALYLIKERGALNLIPLFLYDHSGISMSAGTTVTDIPSKDDVSARGKNPWDSAGWDTSMVGYIYTTEELIDMTGAPRESIDEQLRGEVKEYSAYLEGSVWEYVVERRHCDNRNCPHNVTLESGGGYYDASEALVDGRSEAQSFLVLKEVPQNA